MPGLTLWMTAEANDPAARARFSAAQSPMLHGPRYATETLIAEKGLFLGYVKYPEYPLRSFKADSRVIYLEGRIYNKDAPRVEAELRTLASKVLADPDRAATVLTPWVVETEGEYAVVLADPDNRRLLLFTDPFTRLPLFYHANDRALLLARECKFVLNLKERQTFDRLGWAELLTFNHLLGRRTPFEDVRSAPGGAFVDCRIADGAVRTTVSSLYTANFDEKDSPGKSLRAYATELVDLWRSRCRPWGTHPDIKKNVISLSGGKDSRVVAAIMAKEGISCVAASYLDAHGVAGPDVAAAEQLAAVLGIPWRLFKLDPPSRQYKESLVRMSDGINPVANAKMLPYLERIVAEYGRDAMYITGDGGDFIFPDLRLPGEIRAIDEAARYFLGLNPAATPPADVEAMLGLEPGSIAAELRDLLASYPETNVMQKVIHYRGYERGQNWVFGGEDRTRFHLWEGSPHYFFSIFQYCMRIPDALKAHDALYCEFMRVVSPTWAAIPEANLGLPLTSPWRPLKFRIKHWAMDLPIPLREFVRFLVRGRRPKYVPPEESMTLLRAAFDASDGLGAIMKPDAVYRRLQHVSRAEFENFWTLVLLERLRPWR